MKKGITPVISIVLLLMIVIAIIGLAFAFMTGIFSSAADEAGQGIENVASEFERGIRIESATTNNIYLRNTGDGPISGADIYVYVNDIQTEFTIYDDIVAGTVGIIDLDESLSDGDNVKVVYGVLENNIKVELNLEKGLFAYYKFNNNARDNIGGNHGTPVGDVTYVDDAERGIVASFDGDGDYIDLGNPSDFDFITGRPDVTVTAWVKANELLIWKGFITNSETGQHDGRVKFGIGYSFSNTALRVDWEDDTDFQNAYYSITGSFNEINKWYHVAVTANSEELKIYLDGEQSGDTKLITMDLGTQLASWKIGTNYGDYESTYSWNGYIDEVRFYNRVLSAGEIKTLYLE